MNSTNAILWKNLVLVLLVLVTIINIFQYAFTDSTLLIIQSVLGFIYAFLSYIEYNNPGFKVNLPEERYTYFPGSYVAIRFIKIGIYFSLGGVLAFSPSGVKILYPVCLVLALTEILISLLKYCKKLCFVNVYSNYILIALNQTIKIYASEVEKVEFRHEIFYLVDKKGKTRSIKTFSIQDKDIFINKMKDWIVNNDVKISEESAQRLKGIN